MVVDPLLFKAGVWIGAVGLLLIALTAAGFLAGWGIRFRMVGVSSFTVLLAVACMAFAVSYEERQTVPGAVNVPVVFDNSHGLVVAAVQEPLPVAAVAPTLQQLAVNQSRRPQSAANGHITVRLRQVEPAEEAGVSRPRLLGEARLPLGGQPEDVRLLIPDVNQRHIRAAF
ncbi:MAG: hypothetical protein TQ37_03640 [Candidatus Synechococcus spongiarum 15L]|uniref:Uncharacterized protein n=3 Tax=Candidatus Synechococcus spongiarum TaxID=431041 RepID=A0A1T1CRN4_9SYNE|nr:DUF2518 family protein [Candidatus Synechococcus spongiarum]KKZ13741.1 MAG: hypothetical protein TQ37_03640 [Candidatus Synechococcus spongiarum 15L]MCY4360437.1 DUF2518 family protein [Cyanobacteria bacterium MAG APA_bin_95]OOV31281.1 hypothetical protein BV61_04775 [Candidatus Synechococcus spongiarum LMB bulk15M]OOV34416.1 hypothetical protein BV53_05790 [Candidatus Synechococcus spongiarum LMB bulk15N]